jgi:hypothetical protein
MKIVLLNNFIFYDWQNIKKKCCGLTIFLTYFMVRKLNQSGKYCFSHSLKLETRLWTCLVETCESLGWNQEVMLRSVTALASISVFVKKQILCKDLIEQCQEIIVKASLGLQIFLPFTDFLTCRDEPSVMSKSQSKQVPSKN